jgi:hypothetical protein
MVDASQDGSHLLEDGLEGMGEAGSAAAKRGRCACFGDGYRWGCKLLQELQDISCGWKMIWLLGVLVWAPLAFTVLLVVPGSMGIFLAVWTPLIIKCAVGREVKGHTVSGDESHDGTIALLGPVEIELSEGAGPSLSPLD